MRECKKAICYMLGGIVLSGIGAYLLMPCDVRKKHMAYMMKMMDRTCNCKETLNNKK